MMNCLKYVLVLLLFGGTILQSFSQNQRSKLEKEYATLMKEIKSIETSLKTTEGKKSASLHELRSLQVKIDKQESLIRNIRRQINQIEKSIDKNTEEIAALNSKIESLKSEYAKLLRYTFKQNHTFSSLLFVISASSFNEAINRYNYLKRYREFQLDQADLIKASVAELEKRRQKLEEDKQARIAKKQEQQEVKQVLLTDKKERSKTLTALKSDEARLRKAAQAKDKEAQALNKQIKAIIEEEIRLARERERKANENRTTTTSTPKEPSLGMTPAEQLISQNFAGNKARLPWPVARGHIIQRFGKRPHPTLSNVSTYNNGIDIKTESKSEVRALFEGTVISVFYMPATQNSVIVKHGEYFSVYSNLGEVYVRPQQKITTKETLGIAYTNNKKQLTSVHLEIWKGMDKLNPELWVSKK